MDRVSAETFEMRITITAMLERDRIRDARRKRDSEQPLPRRRTAPHGIPVEVDDETTDMHELVERERAKVKGTERPPRPGTHHDGDT
jgi:hypothetical protein